jgi:hypothetical protein
VLRVPHELVSAASMMVRAFVRAHLGRALPLTGRCHDVFFGRAVAWVPALEVAAALGPRLPGNLAERGGSLGHDGRRVALVEAGRSGPPWRPPLGLLRAFDRGEAHARVPEQESERAARLARERWDVFRTLFAKHGRESAWQFVVCAAQELRGGGTDRLWWVVEEVRGGRVRAQLVSEPFATVTRVQQGVRRWLAVGELVDWAVHTPEVVVDPSSVRLPA